MSVPKKSLVSWDPFQAKLALARWRPGRTAGHGGSFAMGGTRPAHGKPHLTPWNIGINYHVIPMLDFAFESLESHGILNQALYSALQGPCTIGPVVAFQEQQFLRSRTQLQSNFARGEQMAQIIEAQLDNTGQLLFTQGIKHHDIIHSIQELRTKMLNRVDDI